MDAVEWAGQWAESAQDLVVGEPSVVVAVNVVMGKSWVCPREAWSELAEEGEVVNQLGGLQRRGSEGWWWWSRWQWSQWAWLIAGYWAGSPS